MRLFASGVLDEFSLNATSIFEAMQRQAHGSPRPQSSRAVA